MTDRIPQNIAERLQHFRQTHLLRWWDELNALQRRSLLSQLESIDFERVAELTERQCPGTDSGASGHSSAGIAERAAAPLNLVRLPQSAADRTAWREAERTGTDLLAAGKVAAILVAGGQGTRLGFNHPKGMWPIGPVSERSLFQLFAEQLRSRSRRAGVAIPYLVMTSDATHEETVEFFATHSHFGLNPDDVFFFQQGTMPAVDAATGRILLAGKHAVALSPDGHGGMLAALRKAGLFGELQRRGVDVLYYHQVDNPASILCDPVFLGFHVLKQSEMSTKVVAKIAPEEPMGVVASAEGANRIVEYSDLPPRLQQKTDAAGGLWFWAGNTAMHVFDREFLERTAADRDSLPFHVAQKKVECLNDAGELVRPAAPNAWKFEQFIFDVLPRAANALVLETDRASEFLPVKTAQGSDSPETSRAGLVRLYQSWLREADVDVAADVPVEISPLVALDAADLRRKPDLPRRIEEPTVFET